MNILNNKNKRISIFKALALCLFAAVSLTAVSCDDDMDIQQSYPFTVETMPVPNNDCTESPLSGKFSINRITFNGVTVMGINRATSTELTESVTKKIAR